jgi:methionine-rich copper-binding protein CopC
MTSFVRRTVAIAAVALVPASAYAAFHNHLVKSAPLTGETVSAPKEITLWFAEKPEVAFSTVDLVAADSSHVAVGKLGALASDTLAVTVPVTGAVKAGEYSVSWKTAGKDGHSVRGKYKFTVK